MRNLLLHSWATLLLALTVSFSAHATEGMWIPTLLEAVEGDMQTFGLELTAADLYSVNQSSLKDAIVLFGGGCTASVISKDGLLLTNHHCGYSQIQQHSSVEHDYLKDGFWAASHKDELPNPGLTATFIVRIDDVTGEMNKGITAGMSPEAEQELFEANRKRIEADATEGTAYAARVKAFNYGNSYFVIVTRTFDDVRLVGAPPSSIGKFGGDTDNWVWPRHTGDFSLFRIYAGADNGPAAYNEANRPWQPEEHLKVNMDGVQEGDFTMVYGFPGRDEPLQPHAYRHASQQLGADRRSHAGKRYGAHPVCRQTVTHLQRLQKMARAELWPGAQPCPAKKGRHRGSHA